MKLKIIFIILLFTNIALAENFKFNKITKLDKPWGSTFINNDQILVTEKGGKIKLINIKKKDIKIIDHNLNFLEHGQGGLLDIIYKDDVVWISYTENRGNWKTSTSIAKGLFDEKKIKFENIFQADPPIESMYHFGSRYDPSWSVMAYDHKFFGSIWSRLLNSLLLDEQMKIFRILAHI